MGLSKIRSQRLTLTEQIRIISSLTSLNYLLILPKTFRLLSKHLVCQISHVEARYCQPFQLFSLFRRSKNMIIIVLSIVCTSRKNDGIFLKLQNLKIPHFLIAYLISELLDVTSKNAVNIDNLQQLQKIRLNSPSAA